MGIFNFKLNQIDYIVVGLGNPGREYENTRHNVGFMVLDKIAEELDIRFAKNKFRAELAFGDLFGKKVLFMKPSTYMNNSGVSVAEAMNFYKISAQKLIVIYDDISFDVGDIKIKKQGSANGHNGMKSVMAMVGEDGIVRIKVGVSKKPQDWNLADWVLSKFKVEEISDLKQGVCLASDALSLIIKDGVDIAMNKFNKKN